MSKQVFDQDAFGREIASRIDEQPLTYRQSERLRAAREAALAHAHARAHASAFAGVGGWFQRQFFELQHARRNLAFMMLFGIAVAAWWQLQPDVGTDDEVDAMLLADELPPDAYLSDQVERLTQGS
jgi:hypothetical protein